MEKELTNNQNQEDVISVEEEEKVNESAAKIQKKDNYRKKGINYVNPWEYSPQNQQKLMMARAIPLERLYAIRRSINDYHEKWCRKDKKGKYEIVELLDSSATEKVYVLFQYLNRTASAVGASLYLAGEAGDNSYHKQIGGATTVASVYVELISSFVKEKIFKTEERNKKWGELKKDTEDLYNNYRELSEIIKPYREKLSKNIGNLKDRINEFRVDNLLESSPEVIVEEPTKNEKMVVVKDDKRGEMDLINKNLGKLTFLRNSLINKMSCQNFFGLSREICCCITCCPCYCLIRCALWDHWLMGSDVKRFFLFFDLEEYKGAEDWEKEWESRGNERKKIIKLMESLLKEMSEYRQGIFTASIDDEEKINTEERENIISEDNQQYELQILVHPKGNKSL